VPDGLIAYKIAAHAADVHTAQTRAARDRDDELSAPATTLTGTAEFELSLDLEQ